MSATLAEDVLLNFDDWLGRQDQETRTPIEQHLSTYSEGERESGKRTLASMLAVGAVTGIDSGTLNDKWNTIRGGFSEKRGGEYLNAKDDEAKFHALLRRDAQQQKDERSLLSGDDSGDKASRDASLESRLFSGVALGVPAAQVLGDWQRENYQKPGYDVKRSDKYFTHAQAVHAAATERLAPVMPYAKEAFAMLATGQDLEQTSELLFSRYEGLSDPQRRDMMTGLRIVADANPDDAPTFWTNLEKAASRQVGSMGRGVADYGSAYWEALKLSADFLPAGGDPVETLKGTAQKLGEHNLESDIRRVQESTFSPVKELWPKGIQWAEKGTYGAPGALASSAIALAPGVGLPAIFAITTADAYESERFRLRDAGMSDADASIRALALAPIAAAPQAILEKLGAEAMLGRLPALKSTLLKLGDKAGGGLAGYAVRAAGGAAAELLTERAQDMMQPLTDTVAAALEKDMPDVQWRGKGGVLDEFWAQTGETFVSLLPLALIGAGAGTQKHVNELLGASDLQLTAFGARAEDIAALRKVGGEFTAADAVETLMHNRDGNSDVAKVATAELAKAEKVRAATAGTKLGADLKTAGVRSLKRDADGWAITHEDGQVTQVNSAQAAMALVNDLATASTQREADTLISESEAIPGAVTFTGQKVRVTEGGTTSQGVLDPVEKYAPLKGKGLDTLYQEAARVSGGSEINAIVNGSNTIAFREDVAEGAKRITQEIEVNRTEDPAIFTLLHEKVEAVSRTLAEKAARGEAGGMTLAEQAETIVPLAPHFDPATAKNETEKLLFEQVQKVAQGKASAVEAQETLSELAVGEVIRRRKDGTPVRSRMTEAMSAALDAATDPAQVKALGRLRATINALRTYFRAVLGTVAALRRANKEGKSADFEALIDKLTGVDEQARHDMGAMKDAEAMLKKEGVDIQGISASKTYRLSAGNRLEAMQRRTDETLAKDPAKRRIVKERAVEKLRKLQHDAETERQTAMGDRIRPLVEKRTKAELDKEQGAFQAFQADERIKRGMDEKQAHEQARKQSAEWRAEQDRMQKEDWGGRSPLVRDLRALDAVLSVVGPEIRGKVGGHTKLATLGSEQARLAEFQKRLTKLNTELERSLRTEYDDALNALFDKAKPKKDGPGKKKVGKAGADVHALFDTLRAAVDWDAQTAEAHIAGLEAAIATGELSPAEEAHKLQEIGLVNLLADWKNADAARRATAVDEATRVFKAGYAEFGLKKALESDMRQERRDALKKATGKAGTPGERDARMERDTGIPAKWEKIRLNLAPFEQVLWYAFGEKSTDAQRLADSERDASNAKTDEIQAAEMALQAAFTGMAGDELKGAQLHWKLAQKSLDVQGRRLSELEAITATLMWRQPDGRRHMEGKVDAAGQVLSGWHYDQAFIDEIESKLSDEAKSVRSFLATDYVGEWATLNPVYREVNGIDLPHNPNYSPLTVKPQQAQGGQSIDPVTGTTMAVASTTPGSLRTRGSAVAEPDFRDAVQTWIAHKKQMAHWKAYAKLSAEMSALLNNREVRNSVEAAAGKEAIGVISGWNDFLAQGGTRDAAAHLELNQTVRAASSRLASVALIGRISTIAVQATQLGAGLAEMPTGAYVKRLALLMSGNLEWGKALSSPYIQRRIKEMPPVARAAMDGLRSKKPNVLKHLVKKIGWTISGADGLFTAGTFAIVHDYRMKQAIEAGLPEADADKLATTEAERITDRLAQPTRPGARSLFENTATGPWVRLSWAFASESRKNLALLTYAMANHPAAQKLRALAYVVVLNSVLASIIRSALQDLKDRDDDEWLDSKHWNPKRIAIAAGTDWMQGLPVLGDLAQHAVFKGAGVYAPKGNLLDGVERAIPAMGRLPDLLTGELETHEALKDVDAILSGMGIFSEDAAAAASLSHLAKDIYGSPDQ